MSIFSSLSQLIAGQKSKVKLIDGRKVTYRFRGKPIFFDPFALIKDLGYQLNQAHPIKLSKGMDLSSLINPYWETESLQAGVSVSTKMESGIFEVDRFVRTIDKCSLSIYQFRLDNQHLGSFIRCYDYGNSFKSFCSQEAILSNLGEIKNPQAIWIQSENDWSILAQDFGHSQFWVIQSFQGFKAIQDSL